MFFLQTSNDLLLSLNLNNNFDIPKVVLLSGISFFTFHSISYIIDIYNNKIKPSKSINDFGMYMSNFPQLIAGPIIRYSEIIDQVSKRPFNINQVLTGLFLFSLGLSMKIVIADSSGSIADRIFSQPHADRVTLYAWVGALAYTLQIYFDFAGYSTMAIGLGRMMGFSFPENFNQPYRAKNITEFWRRWHMTLSRWFRDYVYIPLGGNQSGNSQTLANLFVVFILCGLWHGASYTFVFWGLYHGVLLVIERVASSKYNFTPSGFIGQLITFLLVIIGWIFFRSENFSGALNYLHSMFSISGNISQISEIYHVVIGPDKFLYLSLGLLFSFYPFEKINEKIQDDDSLIMVKSFCCLFLLFFSSVLIAANGFNPFIYFKF